MAPSTPIEFADFVLDSESAELRKAGAVIDLEPTPFRLLIYLTEHHDRSIPKHELMERVWPDTIVSDTALSTALKEIRRALGDDGQSQRFVRTLRGRGYRFVCPVRRASGGPETAPTRPERMPCLAVLPFVCRSPEEVDEYFADGVTEDLITKLTKIENLCVVSSMSSARFKKSEEPLTEIAETLGVDLILMGSVRRTADRVRISAQLLKGESEQVLWAETYDDRLDDILRIQQDVAERIAAALELELSPREQRALSFRPTPNVGAYDFYLRGRALYRRWTRESNEAAIELYKKAVAADPDFALAYAGLANAYGLRGTNFGTGDEWADASMTHAERALEISGDLPEAHKALGLAYHSKGWKTKALDAYLRAVDLRPTYDEATYNVSQALFELGRWNDAVGWQKRRIQLDPAPEILAETTYAWYLWNVGFPQEAAAWFDRAMDERPLLIEANLWIAERDVLEGATQAARDRVERLRDLHSNVADVLRFAGWIHALLGDDQRAIVSYEETLRVSLNRDAQAHVALGRLLLRAGRRNDAEVHLDMAASAGLAEIERGRDDDLPRWILAAVAAIRGRDAEALEWLERAVDAGHRFHRRDAVDPVFERIRSLDGFSSLMDQMRAAVDQMRERVARERWHRIDGRAPVFT